MGYVKWGVYAALTLAVLALLHYSLPHREVVYVTGQEVKRMDTTVQRADGTETTTRDVNFVYTVARDGTERAYRNEDTDFGWPPYFKFDTATVSAKAENAISTRENPKWMVLTAYGWRLEMFSMFENVVGLREAESRDETLYPWFNGLAIALLVALFLTARWLVRRFYRRQVEPVFDQIGDEYAQSERWWRRQWRRLTGGGR